MSVIQHFSKDPIMISLFSTDTKQLCNLYKMLITYYLIYLSQNLHDLKFYYYYCLKKEKLRQLLIICLRIHSQRNISLTSTIWLLSVVFITKNFSHCHVISILRYTLDKKIKNHFLDKLGKYKGLSFLYFFHKNIP